MYVQYDFKVVPEVPGTEILIAELAELGFESFAETETGLEAIIPQENWKEGIVDQVQLLGNPEFRIQYSFRILPKENWNVVWEQNFNPIRIGRQCVIRAPFHPVENLPYEIIIEPKMSFGTGHHETTYLMLEALLEIPVNQKDVLDMGCGTGVLAILAAMRGARGVDAIDTDSWSYENAIENVHRNARDAVRVRQGDAQLLQPQMYDLILANINRNVLLEDIPVYAESLRPGGAILLSGFYLEDLPVISEKCEEVNLKFEKNQVKNRWVCAKYVF